MPAGMTASTSIQGNRAKRDSPVGIEGRRYAERDTRRQSMRQSAREGSFAV